MFVQFFALFGFIFIVLQYLQLVRGDSGLISALSMLPMAAAMQPAARLAPALTARLGARTVIAAGLALMAVALVVLAQLDATSGYWLLTAGLIPLGAGLGLAMPAATSGITSALPAAQQGVGSALNDLSRETGGAVGIAVLASVLTAAYSSHLHLTGLPAARAAAARSSVAVAARLGGPTAAQARVAVTVLLRGHDQARERERSLHPGPSEHLGPGHGPGRQSGPACQDGRAGRAGRAGSQPVRGGRPDPCLALLADAPDYYVPGPSATE